MTAPYDHVIAANSWLFDIIAQGTIRERDGRRRDAQAGGRGADHLSDVRPRGGLVEEVEEREQLQPLVGGARGLGEEGARLRPVGGVVLGKQLRVQALRVRKRQREQDALAQRARHVAHPHVGGLGEGHEQVRELRRGLIHFRRRL